MKQNISITRARTHKLKIRLTGPDGQPHVMTANEQLIFGVKKALTDSNYTISKTVEYDAGFESVASGTTYKPNTYYLKTTSAGVDTYTLATSSTTPAGWPTNYYSNNGLYSIDLVPSDTQNLVPTTYYYDVGLKSGVAYYSVIDTSKLELTGNVTKPEAQ